MKTKRSLTIVPSVACLALVTFFTGISSAQDYRARVQGVITDSTEAVLVGARITLLNTNTGVSAIKTSNASGQYVFDFVEPGTYTVTVEQTGFSKFVEQNILVQVRGDVTVNAALKVGELTETINVSESGVALQFNTSTME